VFIPIIAIAFLWKKLVRCLGNSHFLAGIGLRSYRHKPSSFKGLERRRMPFFKRTSCNLICKAWQSIAWSYKKADGLAAVVAGWALPAKRAALPYAYAPLLHYLAQHHSASKLTLETI